MAALDFVKAEGMELIRSIRAGRPDRWNAKVVFFHDTNTLTVLVWRIGDRHLLTWTDGPRHDTEEVSDLAETLHQVMTDFIERMEDA